MIHINLRTIRPFLEKHGPTILTGLAMFGVAATGYLTHVADKKLIGDVCERIVMTEETETPVKEIVAKSAKANWKIYIPPVVVGLATMGCAFGANKWHLSKEGALAAAAIMYKANGEEFEHLVKEKFGEDNVIDIKKQLKKDTVEKNENNYKWHKKGFSIIFTDNSNNESILLDGGGALLSNITEQNRIKTDIPDSMRQTFFGMYKMLSDYVKENGTYSKWKYA